MPTLVPSLQDFLFANPTPTFHVGLGTRPRVRAQVRVRKNFYFVPT